VRVDPDLAYAAVSPAQRLDLYRPQADGQPSAPQPASRPLLPLVMVIHGGGFEAGDKREPRPIIDALAAAGYAVASLNYRLSGEATYPAAVQDVKAAARWLRANAAGHGLDPARFGVIGESAGGYLAAMLGATGGSSLPGDVALGNPGTSDAVQAVVDLYGPVNFATMDGQLRATPGCAAAATHDAADSPESRFLGRQITQAPDLVREASPISYLGGGRPRPPFMIEHGAADCIVPSGQSEELAAAISAAGGPPAALTVVPGAGHGTVFPFADRLPDILAFLDRTLRA
jgi:acetyl esterase/lipase